MAASAPTRILRQRHHGGDSRSLSGVVKNDLVGPSEDIVAWAQHRLRVLVQTLHDSLGVTLLLSSEPLSDALGGACEAACVRAVGGIAIEDLELLCAAAGIVPVVSPPPPLHTVDAPAQTVAWASGAVATATRCRQLGLGGQSYVQIAGCRAAVERAGAFAWRRHTLLLRAPVGLCAPKSLPWSPWCAFCPRP
ncbi:hypothetical protein OAN61_00685 [bacterium]|nr:hypothetical protein [bacterium]